VGKKIGSKVDESALAGVDQLTVIDYATAFAAPAPGPVETESVGIVDHEGETAPVEHAYYSCLEIMGYCLSGIRCHLCYDSWH
jgi:hypothetical protein